MKRIALFSLLCLGGGSLFASAPNFKELLDKAIDAPKDGDLAAAFTNAVITHRLNIDRDKHMYSNRRTFAVYLNSQLSSKDADVQTRARDILKVLEQHRSEPDKADEFRVLIKAAEGNAAKLAELEAFLKDKCLNIDLIAYDIYISNEAIASVLGKKNDPLVVNILKLDRINHYRYHDYYTTVLHELMMAVLADPTKMGEFETHYTEMLRKKGSVDIDILLVPLSGKAVSGALNAALENDDVKAGALLIAELVHRDRSDKEATVRGLFKAFEKDPKHVEVLKEWFKNHPVDVGAVAYDPANAAGDKLSTKLDALVTSRNASVKVAAIAVADLVRPHRDEDIQALKGLIEDYKKDKTKLDKIKDWLKLYPVDIDSVLLDRAKAQGETLGDSINALNDGELSAIFKDSRSKVPQSSRSWLSPRNLVIGAAVVAGMYLWHRHQSQNGEQEKGKQLPALS